jgi:hypothetical protein
VQAARHDWQASQPTLEVSKLVLLDETGLSTHMTRAYYYSVTKMGHQDLLVNGDSRGNAAGRAAGAGRG